MNQGTIEILADHLDNIDDSVLKEISKSMIEDTAESVSSSLSPL